MNNEGNIIPVDISKEMQRSYIDYAMSVIVGRALPDVRDGLKPVHRRILYSMHELGLTPEKGYRKSARIVGDVLGKYHPHGDTAVYDALVRMAQDFSIRYTLVDGHGNFGSVDGDGAAAMRYTEAKMTKVTLELLRDINKNTVDFIPNFDGEEKEPSVLPSRFPNLLVNGSSGIAVGMATNIPPHNLTEVINGISKYIDNPDISVAELMAEIKGPDFPTAGIIVGKSGIKRAYETGRGKVVIRSKAEIEEDEKGKSRIVVTEIPYQVNKARLIESIANLVKDKRINGISDLRDESDRQGMRIVIELKRDANANVVLNQLYKHTKMQDSFGIIMLALVNGEPRVLSLKEVLKHYIKFQEEVITRRTQFDLDKALARAHILEGLRIALDHIDEVIKLIRSSKTTAEAREGLMSKFNLSEKQANAILDMKLQRLTGLEREKIEEEYAKLMESIKYFREILSNKDLLLKIIKDELNEIKIKYGDERRTEIVHGDGNDIDIEDLIEEKDVVITLTHAGYIKRLPVETYSAQRRGGRGIQAMTTKEDDFVEHIITSSTHDNILFFSNRGRVYKLKAYQIPEAGRTAKGMNLINLLPLEKNEKIQNVIYLKEFKPDRYLIMGTKNGLIKKTSLDQYSSIRKNGLNAINLRENDELISVRVTTGDCNIIYATKNGYAIKFDENDARPMGRNATGVKAITLRDDDEVVSMEVASDERDLLVVSENGYGKRTPIKEYTLQKRGGKGVITYKISEKTGLLIGARSVEDEDELMLINDSGIAIRINVSDISVTSRNAMGVTLMRTVEEEKVVTMAKVNITEEEMEEGSNDSQQIAQDELEENNSEINQQVDEEINE
ncbi:MULTISPECIES: DNA gyrase subunit A [Clostridium]|uniref:DNA gyrase subunit A n=1 Tax=Clostridium novyi (strain NT) TaxID=386415 RepID=A0Q3U0_CLONN|nr:MULTISPECIES: DNA gyrase subunit A [Clostridium]ABK62674.1 DNA gyrase, A subunit [Clostridium novyi NT]KEH86932.1 DNA gyrase subunit A [Clostridium novyi A str. NCTC 538]KEH89823.1 DNA gyrase subunit A [Clostridium novyi A str. BKT29909]KEH89996.1 DNA gyrase subunit A [Clostridium novyi A str. 4540]KEH92054.1 DNA gyrase subunit A [Clostridium botulinum C/D str. It1]